MDGVDLDKLLRSITDFGLFPVLAVVFGWALIRVIRAFAENVLKPVMFSLRDKWIETMDELIASMREIRDTVRRILERVENLEDSFEDLDEKGCGGKRGNSGQPPR